MELKSKTIKIRLVEASDAEFIYTLRTDNKYNNFLSKISGGVDGQKKWIKEYKDLESMKKEFYFIIERLDGTPCGTVRVYDFKGNSFCWGSWILNSNKTKYAALESAFLVYEFGFETLGYCKSHFDVMKENKKVITFHKKMGAKQLSEDNENYYFSINKDSINVTKVKFKRYIENVLIRESDCL